jgi:hypothetical protein
VTCRRRSGSKSRSKPEREETKKAKTRKRAWERQHPFGRWTRSRLCVQWRRRTGSEMDGLSKEPVQYEETTIAERK